MGEKKEGRDTKKRAITHTEQRRKEEKKREARIESVTSNREHRFVYGISSVLFFSKPLSLILKSEFLFGKTNRVGFHEFLTPCMKLYTRVPDS